MQVKKYFYDAHDILWKIPNGIKALLKTYQVNANVKYEPFVYFIRRESQKYLRNFFALFANFLLAHSFSSYFIDFLKK